ncbi:MAG: LysR family transcriptional regulator [Desulfobacula sp.]|jgi:LysR family transcriptional regulator, transcriptional activator of the cysJI operon|uniref:LysR family transcriptional regulator n=2 Tax=Desulfobacula sp. TaxID=2593537 RepID=UPI001E0FDB1C|nr:LysR family transcriptional regulator [Desulfobacula sp.]MBT6338386.1 LysR family transcriptional regulator [Desulfobacula sp.]
MNLNQLKLFYLAVKHKSLSHAAEELNITQPAVTKGIQRLQEYYEVPLVHKLGKNMELTLAGDNLFQIAKKIFDLENIADDCMTDFQSENLKHLKINASESFGAYYLPEFINRFNVKSPKVRVTLEVLSNQLVVENTINLKNDIGFVSFPVKDRKLNTIEIVKDEIVIILGTSHSLAQKKQLKATDLEGHMIIMHEQGSYFQKMIHDLLKANNVSVTMPITFSNNEAIKRAVEGGTGIAPISKKVAAKEIESGKLIALSLSSTALYRTFYMIHHMEKHISEPLKQFMNLIQQQ